MRNTVDFQTDLQEDEQQPEGALRAYGGIIKANTEDWHNQSKK